MNNLYRRTIHDLKILGVNNPEYETRLIFCSVFNKDYSWIITNPNYSINRTAQIKINKIIRQRSNLPIEYILGKVKFHDSIFTINKSVLIPRPETELLVEIVVSKIRKLNANKKMFILDVGTGSGAIAVSLAVYIRNNDIDAKIIALDISKKALQTAKLNAIKNRCYSTIEFLHSDLLTAVKRPANIITANLPYVPSANCKPLADPRLALDGGKDGTDIIIKLLKQIKEKDLILNNGYIILEIGHNQSSKIIKYSKKLFPKSNIKTYKDLAGYNRIIEIRT